jgi:hypothetical protein
LAFVLAGGTDRTADPLHGDLLAAAEHADDGFDNRATLILRRLTIDEDVVL